MNDKTLVISQPVVEELGNRIRLSSKILLRDNVKQVWFEVSDKYGRYLCWERSDAFLVGLLRWAMVNQMDIVCEAPVTERLLYQIETYLIPAVTRGSARMHASRISAPIAKGELPNEGAVGTGLSCGVDSLHVLAKHTNPTFESFKLTHLVINNVGAFHSTAQYHWQVEHAKKFSAEYGYELLVTDSNLSAEFPQEHVLNHTYAACFAVLAMQKLWRIFYYGSSGLDFGSFDMRDSDLKDAALYDLLSLDVFSTNSLKLYSEGGAISRYEKTEDICAFEPSHKYLHVCVLETGKNCNHCVKCRRTLVTLDALNSLELFRSAFDVDYYLQHRRSYLRWMIAQNMVPNGDRYVSKSYLRLKERGELRASDYLAAMGICAWAWAKWYAKKSRVVMAIGRNFA